MTVEQMLGGYKQMLETALAESYLAKRLQLNPFCDMPGKFWLAAGLLAAMRIHAPVFIDGLSGDLLTCEALRLAVLRCLSAQRLVVIAADASARDVLHMHAPLQEQVWYDVPEDEAGQAELLEALIPEAALRF